MPWQLQAMKDVVVCDKPRVADKQALIRGFPNGATYLGNTRYLLWEANVANWNI
jgi:hypothetical protein